MSLSKSKKTLHQMMDKQIIKLSQQRGNELQKIEVTIERIHEKYIQKLLTLLGEESNKDTIDLARTKPYFILSHPNLTPETLKELFFLDLDRIIEEEIAIMPERLCSEKYKREIESLVLEQEKIGTPQYFEINRTLRCNSTFPQEHQY